MTSSKEGGGGLLLCDITSMSNGLIQFKMIFKARKLNLQVFFKTEMFCPPFKKKKFCPHNFCFTKHLCQHKNDSKPSNKHVGPEGVNKVYVNNMSNIREEYSEHA